jgi:hypothetical protein
MLDWLSSKKEEIGYMLLVYAAYQVFCEESLQCKTIQIGVDETT